MKFNCLINHLLIIICISLYQINGQVFQQLSYANAEIGERLIRSTSTTTVAPSTTEKASFFSGIRNIFSKKTTTTIATTTTIRPTTTTTAVPTYVQPSIPPKNNQPNIGVSPPTTTTVRSQSPNNLPSTLSTIRQPPYSPPGQLPSTAKPKEDFPALPPPRKIGNQLPTASPNNVPTQNNVWTNTPSTTLTNKPMVNFVVTQGPPPRMPSINGVGNTNKLSSQAATGTTTSATPLLATNTEIETLTETLFTKDTNNPFRLISVNYQGRTQSSSLTDEAPNPLITANETILETIGTISKLRVLYNNYELDTTVNEFVTPIERKEENEFIDAVLGTSLMRQMMLFLQDKGLVTRDPRTHRDLLKTIWFNLYSRGRGRIGSSAFEHVFLTEIKNGTVSGLHNWVYFSDEERAGRADYKGYIKKLDLGTKGAIVKFRFSFNNINKPVNAMFIGTSPELEMALYTLCFQLRADKECPVSLGGNKFIIRTHTFRYRGKNLIGSAFPEI